MSLEDSLLVQLEVLAEKLGIIVRHENVLMEESSGTGGLCRIDGKDVIFIHAKATAREKVAIMVKALRGYDLSDIYVRPAVRELLDQGVRSVVKVHLAEADPDLATKPAREITAHDVAGLIRGITEKGKGRTAGIFRSTLAAAYSCSRRAPFDGTMPKAFIDFNIETNPVDPIPPIPVKARHRTLTRKESKGHIEALGDDIVDSALKLALYSGGQRMAQILRAEVSDWNADTKTLRLVDPKGKRTEPREHLLPLAPVATSLVAELVARSEKAGSKFLFSSMTKKTPIHVSTPGPRVTEIAQKIGGEPFDLRDVRRTCETMLAGLGISRDIRAQLLSHGISGVQAAHYDRHEYTKEKRAALVKWEGYLKRSTSGDEEAKVVSFEGAAKAR